MNLHAVQSCGVDWRDHGCRGGDSQNSGGRALTPVPDLKFTPEAMAGSGVREMPRTFCVYDFGVFGVECSDAMAGLGETGDAA